MNIVLIHGQGHKGITYTMSHAVLKYLMKEDAQLKEFFLPKDGPAFCVGCNLCFVKGENNCPEAEKVQPIALAMEWADIIILDTPNYVMDMSGAMKNLLDHLAYRWVTHRPHGSMFSKIGIVVSSSAGAPPNGILKSLAKKLKWMCVPKIYRFPLISQAMGVKDLSPAKKAEIEKKARRIAQKVSKAARHPRTTLRVKLLFQLFRKMQKGEASAWNPVDQSWWKEQGWLDKTLPWKG
jgi:multimeric flavodoxin WrbA